MHPGGPFGRGVGRIDPGCGAKVLGGKRATSRSFRSDMLGCLGDEILPSYVGYISFFAIIRIIWIIWVLS